MATRTYRFAITGTITVDDVDLKAALLGLEFHPDPGVSVELTEEARAAIAEQLIGLTDRLAPVDRLRAFLCAGPVAGVRKVLIRWVGTRLPGAELDVDEGVDVDVVPASNPPKDAGDW